MKYFFLFVLLAIFSERLYAQTGENDSSIIARYSVAGETLKNAGSFVLLKVPDAKSFKKNFYAVIRRQLSDKWFIADTALLSDKFVAEKILTANANWKFSPSVEQIKSTGMIKRFYVKVSDTSAFKNFTASQKIRSSLVYAKQMLFAVDATVDLIKNKIANQPFVVNIQLAERTPEEELVINDYDNSTNTVNVLHSKYPDINGAGLTVSVKENLFDTTDIDFKNRFVNTGLNSNNVTNHASIMATLIGGGGNSYYISKGAAWGVNLSSADFLNLLPDVNAYQQYNISVQNHSYGVGIENFYGADAAAYDASMNDDSVLLHVFSSGNAGTDAPTDGQYSGITGFANLTGSFKMAKNVITVGSVDSFFVVPDLSSKGPAYDGRIKPDLVAYGNDGSSGAAAITSGAVLAMQSAYSSTHNGNLPASSIVKAVLINSADEVKNPGPDYYSGYGNVNTYRAVHDMLSGNYFQGSVIQGATNSFQLTVPPNAKNLKITLCWIDPAADANTSVALVNDLDLLVKRNGSSNSWMPWVLNSAPNADSLKQNATRKRDSLNVNEQVTIANPTAGTYTINVSGFLVPQGPQAYTVAYRWENADSFYFTMPVSVDHFDPGQTNIFRWNSTYASQQATIQYSMDKGNSWQTITNAASLSSKYFKWNAPDTNATAIARMRIGTDVYYSDTFTISKPLNPSVGFYCDDSSLIYWNKIPGATSYKIFSLGNKYLQEMAETSDTSFVFANADVGDYIATSIVLPDGREGVKGYTFKYATQGVSCYISNFLADLTASQTAQLQLFLGTTIKITKIEFQSQQINGWQTISTVTNITNTTLTYEDKNIHAGTNNYRCVITLQNGRVLYTAVVPVYYAGNDMFVITPNPVHSGQTIRVLSSNFVTNTFVLYDVTGRKVKEVVLNGANEDVSTFGIAPGMYVICIYSEGAKVYSKKIFIY